MLKNNLSASYKPSWNKNRLRLILALFFIALAIPTAILIKQAYSQLKWEAFHNYRLQAEELTNRIDNDYQRLIEIESARTFTDYSFLNVAANTQVQYLQRSPLSTFPVNSKFPGIVGYFQIDNNGEFTTPLLPPQQPGNQDYGLSRSERNKRQKAQNSIYQILSQNKLVTKPVTKLVRAPKRQAPAEDRNEASRHIGQFESGSIVMTDQMDISQSFAEPAPVIEAEQPQITSSSALSPQRRSTKQIETEQIAPQAAFDKLQEKKAYTSSPSSSNIYSKSKGRLDDLKLEKQYQQKALKESQLQRKEKELSQLKSKKRIVARRKESNVLPEFKALSNVKNNRPAKKDKSLQINMFESEIDAFEFSLLESGHFVLYRKVWRNGLRYIQGLLINPDVFIKNIISRSFYNANVSQSSNLTVAYQGNILSILKSQPSRDSYSSRLNSSNSDTTLQGTLLLQKNLSTTLEQLELVYSVSQLPAGPGGTVITWLSVILFIILLGGFYSLYHLGLKQLVLARQQQDFVSAVSHELKTPLTSIRMYGEMLREGWTSEEKRKQYYDYIYDESERLTRLINNVLQLARMTRNELPVDLKSCSIGELLDNTYSKINSQVERAEFTLNLSCDDEVRKQSLLVDADYFIQVIINLVDNAIKFSAKSDKKQIDIQCKELRNNKIEFAIRDYGPGIDKDQLKKIFNLFYRSENELTRETVGTGIGLSLVKQLVTSMNGKIDVVNKDPGIEFQITFNTN